MRSFQKKAKNPIFGHFGPKRPILDHFWPKRGHSLIFGEKAKTSLFYSFFFIFQYKKSENSNARIFGKMGKYGRTNVWRRIHRLRRETKNSKPLDEKKVVNPCMRSESGKIFSKKAIFQISPQKSENVIFSTHTDYTWTKIRRIEKKCEKPPREFRETKPNWALLSYHRMHSAHHGSD